MFASSFARAAAVCAAVVVLFGCGPSAEEPAAAPKPNKPTHPKPAKADLAKSDGADPTSGTDSELSKSEATGSKAAKSAKKKADSTAATPKAENAPVLGKRAERPIVPMDPSSAHGTLLGFLPRDAWFSVRLPDVAKARAALGSTAIATAFEKSGMMESCRPFLDPLRHELESQVEKNASAMKPFVEKVIADGNEFVVSLLFVDFERAGAGNEMPIYAAAFVDLGAKERENREMLRAAKAVLIATMDAEELSGDGFRVRVDGMRIEVAIRTSMLGFLIAPDTSSQPNVDDLFDLHKDESLLAADVVTRSPRALEGEVAYAQAYFNIAPLVRLARGYTPKDEQSMFDALGFDSLAGVAAELSIAGSDLHDTFSIVSPGRRDIFTDGLVGKSCDPSFARYTLEDGDDVGVSAFDLNGLYDAIHTRLSPDGRRIMSEMFAQMKVETGIDLKRDVLENFGPGIAYSTIGAPALVEAGLGEMRFATAIEVRSAESANRVINAIVSAGLPVQALREQGVDYWRIDVPEMMELNVGTPVFTLSSDALLFASDFPTLHKLAATAKDAPIGNPRLRALLDQSSSGWLGKSTATTASEIAAFFSLGQQTLDEAIARGASPEIELPSIERCLELVHGMGDSTRSWTVTDDTIVLESRSPIGSPMLLLAPVMVAGFATGFVTGFENSRLEHGGASAADAEFAQQTLREIAAAQQKFASIRAVDQDGDKVGEFGTFAEMTGRDPVGNGKKFLNPGLLPPPFAGIRDGVVTLNGICFRLAFVGSNGVPIGEMNNGGRPETIGIDHAEQRFVAYAWPEKASASSRAFMIDESGKLYEMIGQDGPLPYAGTDRPLPLDSGFGAATPASTTSGERLGPRGEVWRLVR
jgi:hypothetical protein